jgi:hypothetical protein
MCWAGKVALAIVLLLGSLGIAGALYQQIETWRDARRSPEPGRLVNAGGLRLQINCTAQAVQRSSWTAALATSCPNGK